jgi:hypothetical protein
MRLKSLFAMTNHVPLFLATAPFLPFKMPVMFPVMLRQAPASQRMILYLPDAVTLTDSTGFET